jgi:chromosome segregation protein
LTAPARLLALRLQGFKSFGEKTLVEFGPGISAVVGPNGAGKSNLADALRWALGEQGRALRLRKSEDVIFAGSEKRSALGMADVTLVFGNEDRLLPIDFETVELGRRLFRSGENDYLLNKQRVRLRDLVDLLDAAHLADNAFLFIGQGMVDQALALRPEERRPLFEEVAGVRRHERNKKKAEDQLVEADANLARVEDVLAELRPQARRLAAQAEQQASRQTAGLEYGRAVVAGARSRWYETARRLIAAEEQVAAGRALADAALAALRDAEEEAAELARGLASSSDVEAERRTAHEAARAALTELQLRDARAASDLAAAQRDRARLTQELAAAEADLQIQRRELASPVPARDLALAAAVAEADRSLAEALEELSSVRAAEKAEGDALAALRRVEAARAAELETARRRLADAERRAADERGAADEAARRLAEAEAACSAPRAGLARAAEEEKVAIAAREAARAELDRREGARQATAERAAAAGSRVAGLRGRLEALRAQLGEDEARGIAKAARRAGGRPLSDGMEVEAGFRVAVEAALGEAVRGYVVGRDAVAALDGQRGVLILDGADVARGAGKQAGAAERAAGAATEALLSAVAASGGGPLAEALRSDPAGAATRLLACAVWLPDVAAGLAIQQALPAGWIAVTRDGTVLTAAGVVTLGRPESLLERRAELDRLAEEVARLEAEATAAQREAEEASQAAVAARTALDTARETERRAGSARRIAEEAERLATRKVDQASREASWRGAQAARFKAERDRLGETVRQQATESGSVPAGTGSAAMAAAPPPADDRAAAIAQWEARVAALRERRDRLAAEETALEVVRHEAESRRARASASAGLDEQRIAGIAAQTAELARREEGVNAEREGLGEELAAAAIREGALRAELEELRSVAAVARSRLTDAETEAGKARERLRSTQERSRSAEVAALESRMALDSIRDQVLVELAGLGDLGLGLLADEAGDELAAIRLRSRAGSVEPAVPVAEHRDERPRVDAEGSDSGNRGASGSDAENAEPEAQNSELEQLLAAAAGRWQQSAGAEPPAPSRLAQLRRRFHELGAPNPFASEEYAAVKLRLEGLEAQRTDLVSAIAKTRSLIEQLNTMIATQFRSTFAALETAFDARFRQLFGGGFARLSMTEPDDLAATGIEIVARPPGKKAQPLSMLSGGERALTAVALLFSMLEVHPVPFCVLDEVDAALDEANVGRFAEALQGLCDQTQFIVITHNRGTIETADALYGVTVGEDAVSRVISLKLEEARELADQVTRKAANAG